MTTTIHTCECACGLVELRCKGEPIRTSLCHCFAYQRRTGSVFGVQVCFAKECVLLNGEVTRYNRIGDDGSIVQYEFCPACGTTIRMFLSAIPNTAIIPIGLFSDKEFHQPRVLVYEQKRHGWVSFECTLGHIE